MAIDNLTSLWYPILKCFARVLEDDNFPDRKHIMQKIRPTPLVLMLIFCLCLLLGVNLGEVQVVLEKATAICLSCIGIG